EINASVTFSNLFHHLFHTPEPKKGAYNAAMVYYAHSHKEKPQSDWHRLDNHLHCTAERAERFAAPFAKEWGRLAGLWHDAGKYQKAFPAGAVRKVAMPVKGPFRFSKRTIAPSFPAAWSTRAKRYP